MSDNQSDNSFNWRGETTGMPRVDYLQKAKAAVDAAKQELWQAEDAAVAAKAKLRKLEAKVLLLETPITWRQVLCPTSDNVNLWDLYQHCLALGCDYALHHTKIYRVGDAQQGMVDTGIIESDIL